MAGTHRSDSDLLGDLGLRVDIDLVELDTLRLRRGRELLEDGGDLPAGATPRCPEIDHNGLAAGDLWWSILSQRTPIWEECTTYDLLEILEGVDRGDSHGVVCVCMCSGS